MLIHVSSHRRMCLSSSFGLTTNLMTHLVPAFDTWVLSYKNIPLSTKKYWGFLALLQSSSVSVSLRTEYEYEHFWQKSVLKSQMILCCIYVLWRQFFVFSWSGSHIRWGQPFRLRHLSTGHYLALTEDRGLVLQDRDKSDTKSTAFCFRISKVGVS